MSEFNMSYEQLKEGWGILMTLRWGTFLDLDIYSLKKGPILSILSVFL